MTEKQRLDIINLNLHKLRNDYDKLFRFNYLDFELEKEMYVKYGELWDLAKSYNNNYFNKRKRVNKRIKTIFDLVDDEHTAFFVTLTFDDKFLAPPFDKSKRRLFVSRFCKKYFDNYLANIDYGKKGGREHYHCVVLISNCKFSNCIKDIKDYIVWDKGFSSFLKIRLDIKDFKRVKNYLLKLTYHALKQNGKGDKLIFCRKK